MKVKSDFVLKEVAGQWIVAPSGDASISFNAMITLNDSGAFLWKALEGGASEEELVLALLDEYEVSEETARAGARNFVEKMREANLLDD